MTIAKQLDAHAACSRKFGADTRMVFLGGGNTSYKTGTSLYIKPSGVALATIQPDQFVALDRAELRNVFTAAMPAENAQRERRVQELMAAAVRPLGAGRPSVEAPLHEIIPYPFVYHMHPALVNGMTCGRDGAAACRKLFPEALWVEYVNPGYTLSMTVAERLKGLKPAPQLIFLQNHGVFVGAGTLEEIEALYARVLSTLETVCRGAGVALELTRGELDADALLSTAPVLRSLLGTESARAIVAAAPAFVPAAGPLSPDHMVYAKSFPLVGEITPDSVAAFKAARGYLPRVVALPGKAVFGCDSSLGAARDALTAAENAALTLQLTAAFGGPNYIGDGDRAFIENWEVESYRRKVAGGASGAGRVCNKVCVITGAAQGFGLGIAQGLAAEGAIVVIADMNLVGAQKVAAELGARFGRNRVLAVGVDVSDEASVEAMVREVTRQCGGLDVLVANAGVLRAGSLKTMTKRDWDLVTAVNYTGYFLCAKHAARVMATQNAVGCGPWTDIIQINSKSGLEGSNRNAAYAGGKFGAIGLTQSFAKELVNDRIKVNSICPGNYFEGPLWSDPANGLFVQYLRENKVPGAKTLADVKKSYESKVPMGRGCLPEDVVRAILYAVEQAYETGQAMPVTGGQVMLR
jgi:NAD(P)-dependent dehydrogenase (short-subunit alcohol dehydrogenase family)/rhamnose utilization protein RhaD (predicted bifunctional aldolase and dehydrogenase)